MDQQEMKAFFLALDQVAEVLGASLSATKKTGYWLALQGLALDEFQGACVLAMREESFFPVPTIFREYAREWHRQHTLVSSITAGAQLALRDALVSPEDVRGLLASVWPEEYAPAYERPLTDAKLAERKAYLHVQAEQLTQEEQ